MATINSHVTLWLMTSYLCFNFAISGLSNDDDVNTDNIIYWDPSRYSKLFGALTRNSDKEYPKEYHPDHSGKLATTQDDPELNDDHINYIQHYRDTRVKYRTVDFDPDTEPGGSEFVSPSMVGKSNMGIWSTKNSDFRVKPEHRTVNFDPDLESGNDNFINSGKRADDYKTYMLKSAIGVQSTKFSDIRVKPEHRTAKFAPDLESGNKFVSSGTAVNDFKAPAVVKSAIGVQSAEFSGSSSSNNGVCFYNGHCYIDGETFTIDTDECTICRCAEGNVRCKMAPCPVEEERGWCLRFETVSGRCCPVCVERGCRLDGVAYPRAARIPRGPCELCFCPWEPWGGKVICGKVVCPAPDCVDAKVPPNKCCPVCPNGRNCWLENHIIPYGQDVWVAQCRSCACPERTGSGNEGLVPKAVCKYHNDCVYGR